jgi:hypothetical protein
MVVCSDLPTVAILVSHMASLPFPVVGLAPSPSETTSAMARWLPRSLTHPCVTRSHSQEAPVRRRDDREHDKGMASTRDKILASSQMETK